MKPRLPRQTPGFEPTEQEIQHAAYFLWEQAGKPAGRDHEMWFAARERLRHHARTRAAAPRGPAAGLPLSEKSIQSILSD